MRQLVRYSDIEDIKEGNASVTPRERRLYLALAVILSLNLSVICGALTFFGLLFGP
jgi:hypothetical protein